MIPRWRGDRHGVRADPGTELLKDNLEMRLHDSPLGVVVREGSRIRPWGRHRPDRALYQENEDPSLRAQDDKLVVRSSSSEPTGSTTSTWQVRPARRAPHPSRLPGCS